MKLNRLEFRTPCLVLAAKISGGITFGGMELVVWLLFVTFTANYVATARFYP
jgi:hypothetical protein